MCLWYLLHDIGRTAPFCNLIILLYLEPQTKSSIEYEAKLAWYIRFSQILWGKYRLSLFITKIFNFGSKFLATQLCPGRDPLNTIGTEYEVDSEEELDRNNW